MELKISCARIPVTLVMGGIAHSPNKDINSCR